ncbi:MAG: ribbon-helix-helix domain-containing protein [Candidatus Dormibacteraceae bacterium]
MSKQVTVRLDDRLVAFVDRQVANGRARSRAAVVAEALERELDRTRAERDIEILLSAPNDPVLEAWAKHAHRVPMPDLD